MSRKYRELAEDQDDQIEASPPCWLCTRPLGSEVERHHPVPKKKGGRSIVLVHPICHQTIHANFTNSQLARIGEDIGMVREDPAIAKFIEWVAGKPADFHAPTHGGR